MKIFGLIGHPLEHSFSKSYFEDKFEKDGLPCRFVNYDIESLKSIRDIISNNPDLKGFTVTHPYKKEIITYLDCIDEDAKAIGAVNVVHVLDNKLYGYNTDFIGFNGLLEEAISNMCINSAYVCGTGGASEAVKYVLNHKGIKFHTLSRKDKSYEDIMRNGFKENELVVNATPVGMYPNCSDILDLPYDTANKTNVFIDLIYNPEETMFMKEAKRYGAKAYNGLKMLTMQAEAAWGIWSDF